MPVVLCFGNPDIPEDAVAVELGRSLDVPGFTFVHLSSPEEIVDYIEEDVYVMDVAQGIDEVTLITDRRGWCRRRGSRRTTSTPPFFSGWWSSSTGWQSRSSPCRWAGR